MKTPRRVHPPLFGLTPVCEALNHNAMVRACIPSLVGKKEPIRSNQTRGMRFLTQVAIAADNYQNAFDIQRGPAIEVLMMRFSGTFAITVTGTAIRNIAAYRLLRRADFALNSSIVLDAVSGTQLVQLYVTRRNTPTVTNPANFTVAAGYTFDVCFLFDRALMDMVHPKDSVLKTDVNLANLQLRVQLGSLNDMFTNVATATTYTAATLSLSVVDFQEERAADGSTPDPRFYIKRNGFTQAFGAAANGQLVKLTTGNRLRIVSLRALVAATSEPDITMISRFGLKRAGDQRVDMPTTELRRMNEATYGVALLTGQVLWDFGNVGQLIGVKYSEFWPIPSSADTQLVVDVSAACILDIVTLEGVDL